MAITLIVASLARQFAEAFNGFTAFICIVAQTLNLTGDFEEKAIRDTVSLSCPHAAQLYRTSTAHGNCIQKTSTTRQMSIRGPSPGQVQKIAAAQGRRGNLPVMKSGAMHMEKNFLRKDGHSG
jgi:hypothetical protein